MWKQAPAPPASCTPRVLCAVGAPRCRANNIQGRPPALQQPFYMAGLPCAPALFLPCQDLTPGMGERACHERHFPVPLHASGVAQLTARPPLCSPDQCVKVLACSARSHTHVPPSVRTSVHTHAPTCAQAQAGVVHTREPRMAACVLVQACARGWLQVPH